MQSHTPTPTRALRLALALADMAGMLAAVAPFLLAVIVSAASVFHLAPVGIVAACCIAATVGLAWGARLTLAALHFATIRQAASQTEGGR